MITDEFNSWQKTLYLLSVEHLPKSIQEVLIFVLMKIIRDIKPLEQIRDKRYFQKYVGVIQKIFMIGIEFSKVQRNIVGFEWEEVNSDLPDSPISS